MRLRQGATITQLERPDMFVDESTTGPLRFRHVHRFVVKGKAVRMLDEFDFNLRLGVLGSIADRLVVKRHLRRLLEERARYLKAEAERSGGSG